MLDKERNELPVAYWHHKGLIPVHDLDWIFDELILVETNSGIAKMPLVCVQKAGQRSRIVRDAVVPHDGTVRAVRFGLTQHLHGVRGVHQLQEGSIPPRSRQALIRGGGVGDGQGER